MSVRIQGVVPGSPAQRVGLCPGMELLAIDGKEINDGLDYEFYAATARLLVVRDENGEKTLPVQKAEHEALGCEFETYLIDKQHSCRNKCVFCFVDQLPGGMRPSLYFKDDDERLGFLFGNYVTLTNLSQKEIDRIIEMRISPVNISVHTTNPALRQQMMCNKNAGEVLRFIPMLAEAGIQLNTQLVLCPGLNDGDELRRSIEWLLQLGPSLQSIAAVPVGLTRYREGLYPLRAYTAQEAAQQLDIMLEYGDKQAAQGGPRLVYLSDEWFLLAGRALPPESFYDGYPQLENGVGMWRLFYDEFTAALQESGWVWGRREADIVTGRLAYPLFVELAEKLNKKYPKVKMHVHLIENDFFGHGITVTGLLTGGDVMRQLQGKLKTKTLLLPEVTLRAEGDRMLDDVTPSELEAALRVKVKTSPQNGAGLLKLLLQR